MFRTISVVLCLVAATHQLDISNFSVPRAVEMNTNAELICEHDGEENFSIVKWFWSPEGPDSRTQIYQQVNGGEPQVLIPHTEPPLNITFADVKNGLVLFDLQPEHSGTFECQVEEQKENSQERTISSDMVVYNIGDGPQLTIVGSDDVEDVEVSCQAAGVTPAADVVISYNSNTFNTTLISGPVDGLYNVSSNVTLNRKDIDGAEIFCTLDFSDDGIPTRDVMRTSEVYTSNAWLATTTDAPAETTELQARLEAEPREPNSVDRATAAWALAVLGALLRAAL